MRRNIAVSVIALLGLTLTLGPALPASSKATVARGSFEPFAENTDLDIEGHARIVRGKGWTKVRVNVRGLEPRTTYGSHLHDSPCDVNQGGAHYKHDPAGPAEPPNELWPSSKPKDQTAGLTSNPAGNAKGRGKAPWRARPEAQSVVIHAPDGTKIACADLE